VLSRRFLFPDDFASHLVKVSDVLDRPFHDSLQYFAARGQNVAVDAQSWQGTWRFRVLLEPFAAQVPA